MWRALIPIFVTLFTSPIQSSPTYLWAQFKYCIIFYSFKHGPSSCNILEKLRKYGLEGMGQFPSNLLHEPSPCMLPSRQRILIAPQAYGKCLVLKISNNFYALVDCDPKFLPKLFFPLKMVGSPWPTSATSFHSGEPPNGLKQLKRGS